MDTWTGLSATGAEISDCERYRYSLWRKWDDCKPLVFIMLNPSTADATHDDPTINRCMTRARRDGYGGVLVVNLFALRATDPLELKRSTKGFVDPLNTEAILCAAKIAGCILCAWGNHGSHLGASRSVTRLLTRRGYDLYALRVSKTQEPAHPLYLPSALEPRVWRIATPAPPERGGGG